MLTQTTSRLIEKIRTIILKQPNSKERKRAARNTALINYLKSVENTSEYKFFDDQKVKRHISIMDEYDEAKVIESDIIMMKSRLCRTVEFIIKHSQNDIFDKDSSVLEIGDASGIILNFFNKSGTSLNIDEKSHKMLLENGFDSILSDIMDLKLDRKFDYIFAFQVLEHVQNPIAILNKLRQLVNKMIFISIPHKGLITRIRPLGYKNNQYNKTVEDMVKFAYHYHVFEFSPDDFRSVFSHAQLIEAAYEECYNFYPHDPRFQLWALKPLS
ncbi:MAG: methyltransferase domain-containing protein [Nitrospirae bacterium]|nr:methyltransferase domain-containing protein [Nitrospirota bacterium]